MSEGLRTGWEPDTPAGDTLLGDYVKGWATWLERTARACDGRCLRDDDLVLHDAGSAAAFGNVGLLTQPPSGDGAALAARLRAFYDTGAGGPFALFSPWPTPDLRSHDLGLGGHPPLMLRPTGAASPRDPAGLRIEEVVDDTGRAAYDRALVEGFPVDGLDGAALIEPGWLDIAGWRMFVGYVDDRPVASAGAFIGEHVHVEQVATLPDARGRGFGEALTWRATLADPSKHALLIASDPGRPVYERMGYLPLTRFTLWIGRRG
jgi:hypothetical protein